jgi:hypothetical protein
VSISAPASGDVAPNFAIAIEASDNYIVTKVDLWIDGVMASQRANPPYEFVAPIDLAAGAHTVEARAYDPAGNLGTATAMVNLVPECATDAECGEGRVCTGVVCLSDIGSTCGAPSDCETGACAVYEDGFICTRQCSAGGDACPSGFECSLAGGGSIEKCWPAQGGGGCLSVAGGRNAAGGAALLALAMAALLIRRRR